MVKNINRKDKKNINKEALLAALLLFVLARPYFVWGISNMSYGTQGMIFTVIVEMMTAFLFFKNIEKKSPYKKKLILLFFITLFLELFFKLMRGWRMGVVFELPYSLLVFLPLANKKFEEDTFSYFTTIYSIIVSVSLVALVLVTMGYLSPLGMLENTDERLYAEGKNWIHYPFLLISTPINGITESTTLRFCGVFDEPGVIGTVGALLLCGTGFRWKDWRTYPIVISGLLAFSLYFYVTMIGYWLIRSVIVNHNPKYLIGFALIASILYFSTKDIPEVSELIWERIEWDSDTGTLAGDSRTTTNYYYENMGIGELLFGVNDMAKYIDYAFGESSYKNTIATNGLIFFILYIFYFLYIGYSFKNSRGSFILFSFVLLGCMYQRPSTYDALLMFLLIYFGKHQLPVKLLKRVDRNDSTTFTDINDACR